MSTLTAVDQDTVQRFIAAKDTKKLIESQLDDIKAELATLEEQITAALAAAGLDGIKDAATGRKITVTRRVWARAAHDKEAACAALQAAGLGDFVAPSFNTHSLSAYFREQLKQRNAAGDPVTDVADLLPAELADAISLTEDTTLSVRA